MLASIEEVITDEKNRKSFIDFIKQIPIWHFNYEEISSQIDLLGLIPIEGRKTGEILF